MFTLVSGFLYIINSQFFADVNDPYLVKNHPKGLRPYYLAIYDSSTDLYWMIPLSSKVDKYVTYYKKLFRKWSQSTRPYAKDMLDKLMLGIKTVKIGETESVLLFQNMFPVSKKYIVRSYLVNGKPFSFDSVTTDDIISQARKVIELLKNGFKFMSTQQDVNKIEQFLLNSSNV